MINWQPMETAPKDGTAVLLCFRPDADGVPTWTIAQGVWFLPPWGGDARWALAALPEHGCGCCGYDNPTPQAWAQLNYPA